MALGLGITATDDEGFDLMSRVISHEIQGGEEIAAWLSPRLFALDS